VNEYVGIYDEQWVQFYSVKIFAYTKDEAVNKFKQYLKSNAISTFDEQYMRVIPLFALDVI
jgi:acylphosphatase